MPPRSPRSTLFPYTTLFRSHQAQVNREYEKYGRDPRTKRRYGRAWKRIRDRKSTRLNSSHVSISYAVFCLKKKIDSWGEVVVRLQSHLEPGERDDGRHQTKP